MKTIPRVAAALIGLALATAAYGHSKHAHNTAAPAEATFPLETLQVADVAVLDQHGTPRRFVAEVLGTGPVIITFSYTRCTTLCPVTSVIFAEVAATLDAAGDPATRLVTVTVDPVYDTPERLLETLENFGAGPRWTFVTGRPTDIAALLRSFGLQLGAAEKHDPMFLVGAGGAVDDPTTRRRFVRVTGLPAAETLMNYLPEPNRP